MYVSNCEAIFNLLLDKFKADSLSKIYLDLLKFCDPKDIWINVIIFPTHSVLAHFGITAYALAWAELTPIFFPSHRTTPARNQWHKPEGY